MRRSVAVVVAVVALAGACTSDGDGEGATATPAPPTTRPPACPSAAPVAPGDERVTLPFAGAERWYLRHVPPAHDGATPLPVVVDLHGLREGAQIHVTMSRLVDTADREGFVTITPQGSGTDIPFWNYAAGSDDVRFVAAVLDHVGSTACVDTDRVYVTGLSNGGLMTSRLACEYADRIAAAAPVAGITDPAGCNPSRPVPVVAFHGTEDRFLPYAGGVGPAVGGVVDVDAAAATAALPSVDASLTAWAARNGCDDDAAPSEERVADDVVRVAYDCPEGAEVELYRVEGGGHAWPGSEFSASVAAIVGRTTMSISANEIMWSFFRRHSLASG